MKIRRVEFAGSLYDPLGPMPEGLPQIAFSGRSNVGKSSLINTLLRRTRRKLARVSSSPGKTRSVNFYRVNDRFFLVDLPGFGFARVPEKVRSGWRTLVEGYLSRGENLKGVVHLVDARHDPTPGDLRMIQYLGGLGIPTLVILTKIDRLSRARRKERMQAITRRLRIDPDQLVPFSSKTGEGREDLMQAIETLLPPLLEEEE